MRFLFLVVTLAVGQFVFAGQNFESGNPALHSVSNHGRRTLAGTVAAPADPTDMPDHVRAGLLRAARLWGAAQALRERAGVQRSAASRDQLARETAPARERLGEEAFQIAWTEGSAMTLEQAAAYALEAM